MLEKFIWYLFSVNEEFLIVFMFRWLFLLKFYATVAMKKEFNDHNSIMATMMTVNVFRYPGTRAEL